MKKITKGNKIYTTLKTGKSTYGGTIKPRKKKAKKGASLSVEFGIRWLD